MARSLLDLPRKLRVPFCCIYLAAQLWILHRAQRSPDFVFGFQMFNASSNMTISLFREVRQKGRIRLVPVHEGTWAAKDEQGTSHTFHWQDRIRDGVLGSLDTSVHASYGLAAQLYRLQFALEDVAAHTPQDHETVALVARVDTLKNGRDRGEVRLRAARP